jgi:hypothetical protein
MKIQQRPGLAPGIAPHFARRRTSSGCMRRSAAASDRDSVRRCGLSGVRSNTASPVTFISYRQSLTKGARAPFYAAVVSIHSGKCYCSPEGAIATPVVDASNGGHPSVSCGWFAARRRARRFVGVAVECSPGSVQPRESLTQDSRSAVKARLIDPLRGSFGEGRCTLAKLAWRPRQRPSRGFEPAVTRQNGAETQRGGHCARTSLAVPANDDAQTSAMRARCGFTPRRVASSRLATHEWREGLVQHAPPVGGDLGVGLG